MAANYGGHWPEQSQPLVYCPQCGAQLGWKDEIYTRSGEGLVLGCTQCFESHSPVEWYAEELGLPLCV